MWVRLAPWIVQDGQLPELRPGELMTRRSVCISGTSEAPVKDDGIVPREVVDPWGHPEVLCLVTGILTWVRPETEDGAMHCDGVGMIARSTQLRSAVAGDRISIFGGFSLMGEHEQLEFGLPDVARDWQVNEIRVERRAYERRDDGYYPTRVLHTTSVEQIHRWNDEIEGQSLVYLLDLEPLVR